VSIHHRETFQCERKQPQKKEKNLHHYFTIGVRFNILKIFIGLRSKYIIDFYKMKISSFFVNEWAL